MFDSVERSWNFLGESLSVLKRHKRLLWFPVLSAISTVIVSASFFLPLHASGALGHSPTNDVLTNDSPNTYAILFLFYFVNYFVTIFFNAALVAAAGRFLEGSSATVGDGLRAAGKRLGQIAYWALLASTVAVLLSLFRRRAGVAGRVASGLLGTAWSLVTYFVVPVMVFEDRPVWESIDRSMALCRKAWGEEATSGIGFGLIWLLASIPAVVVAFASFRAHSMTGIGVAVLYVLFLATVSSATKGIFTAALYRYAVEAQGLNWFSGGLLSGAFAPRGREAWFDAAVDDGRTIKASLLDVQVIPLEKELARGELYIIHARAGEMEYHASYTLEELDPGFRADSWEPRTTLKLRIDGYRVLISGPGCAGIWCRFTKAAGARSI